MATSAQIREFSRATQALAALAQRDLTDFWRALNTDGNPEFVKAALLEFFPDLIQSYGDAAAILGADWYDMLRDAPPSAARFAAVLAAPPVVERSRASARWALGPLFSAEPDPVKTLSNLAGATQRLVLDSYRTTVVDSARQDRVRMGFARVPVGPTCRFCTTLASRGFVYATEESAGAFNRWHDDCDCIVVSAANKESALPEDYDLDRYIKAYQRGEGTGYLVDS